jgi:hypothetical protein
MNKPWLHEYWPTFTENERTNLLALYLKVHKGKSVRSAELEAVGDLSLAHILDTYCGGTIWMCEHNNFASLDCTCKKCWTKYF